MVRNDSSKIVIAPLATSLGFGSMLFSVQFLPVFEPDVRWAAVLADVGLPEY